MNPNPNGSVTSNSIGNQPTNLDRNPPPQQYQQYQSYQQSYQQPYTSQPMYQQRGYQTQSYVSNPVQQPGYIDISSLQAMIEQYLQFYYTDDEIIRELDKKSIPADMTMYILSKLKEQNPNYFKAYEIRLTIKNQIARFNELIQRHIVTSGNTQQEAGATLQQPVSAQQYNQDMYQDAYGGSYISGFQGDQSMGM